MLSLSEKTKDFLSNPDSKILMNIIIGLLLFAVGLFLFGAAFSNFIPLVVFLSILAASMALTIFVGICFSLVFLPEKIRKILYKALKIEE